MSLRARLVWVVAVVTLLTIGGAFGAVWIAVDTSQRRQFDDALQADATDEARDMSAALGTDVALGQRPPRHVANDFAPMTRFEALYDPQGVVLAATATFRGRAPPWALLQGQSLGIPFDFWQEEIHLRGVIVSVPRRPGDVVLLGAPRTDLDRDAAFMIRAMTFVFGGALVWVVLVASWLVRRMTRDYNAVAAVARKVAAGDMTARVGPRSGDPETTQLARDVDAMIEQLGALLAAQKNFIAHAAHELRSPLTTLYGELSHARRRSREVPAYESAIDEALDATRRLKLLADDLLVLARIGAERQPPPERVVVGTFARAAAQEVDKLAQARGVRVSVEGALETVLEGRANDLERMLRNLVENAIRHSPDGGVVTVTVGAPRGGAIEIAVGDGGPGVRPADAERIFQPFFRGSKDRASDDDGAGLGLAIVRGIARAHGGDAWVAAGSEGEAGARFMVRLAVPEPGTVRDEVPTQAPVVSSRAASPA